METRSLDASTERDEPRLPALPARAGLLLFSPARLFEALRARPRAAGALAMGAVLMALSFVFIPGEVWNEMARSQALEAGRELPAGFDLSGIFRVGALVGGVVFWFVWAFLLAGFTFLVFGFVMGDAGRFRQYLAVTAHAMLVPAVGTLLITPLKIVQRDPRLTLNLGLFVPFAGEGYWHNVLAGLDLFMLWSYVLIALGVHVLDRRRSWAGASAVLLGLALLMAMAVGAVIPT